jgi:uncharacterized protein YigA (DUF484 family)
MSPVSQAAISETIDSAQADREEGEPPAGLNDVQVADWLHAHPDFFDQHADLLSEVKLRHPHGGRAISLVERQVLVLRERNKALESKMAELIRIGQENDAIATRLQLLTRELLRTSDQSQLPAVLVEGLQTGFAVPQVAVRLWGVAGLAAPFGEDVSADTRRRIDELAQPYCGPNSHPEAAGWLPAGGEETGSMALLALRVGANPESFGLLVLGSPDAGRFQAGMGTAFLAKIAEIAGASLSRLLH